MNSLKKEMDCLKENDHNIIQSILNKKEFGCKITAEEQKIYRRYYHRMYYSKVNKESRLSRQKATYQFNKENNTPEYHNKLAVSLKRCDLYKDVNKIRSYERKEQKLHIRGLMDISKNYFK